ncbi:hypothetical protein IAU60_002262 [Kwoniella sp. DSM 27419]
MTSYLPFSGSSSSAPPPPTTLDDPHLQVTVTPTSSAYYAGETFSVTITFTNTRLPLAEAKQVRSTPPSASVAGDIQTAQSDSRSIQVSGRGLKENADLPQRKGKIGRNLPAIPLMRGQVTESSSSHMTTPGIGEMAGPTAADLYSPGANMSYRATGAGWNGQPGHAGPSSPQREAMMSFRSPDGWGSGENGGSNGKELGHTRRARSLALGKGTMSPQELVWALGGQPTPPPLPTRRPHSAVIPPHHPHSRKISVNNFPLSPPTGTVDLASPPLRPGSRPSSEAGPSRPQLTRNSSTNSSLTTTTENEAFGSDEALPRSKTRPTISPLSHSRTPSYHNAYGASTLGLGSPPALPPPTHPYIRERLPNDRGTTTVLWAYTRLIAQFHPSNAYIPPDPLLPLRSLLLHQPVGSGSLDPSPANGTGVAPSSRWQLSFGTGTIGNSTQPSLTGSLFGLAKDLVMGGSGGSLEEERKRVWNMKDLPVLETTRSLLGVDVKLKEGESRKFTYTLQLPSTLPPSHRGKAFRFSYDLVVSLNVALPGGGQRQKSKDIHVPIRVWANVSLGHPLRTYDVLQPIIQIKEEASVQQVEPDAEEAVPPHGDEPMRRRSSATTERRALGDTEQSLKAYAKHLLETLEPVDDTDGIALGLKAQSTDLFPRSPRPRVVSATSPVFDNPRHAKDDNGYTNGHSGQSQTTVGKGFVPRPRQGTFVDGDDELAEEGGQGRCGQAVEILSRHSSKASYDIAKDGEIVAVLTLIKTTYRLGESVLGVVTLNEPDADRRVLKFSAFLESHEIIPQPLLPPPGDTQPPLTRLHAEHRSSYVVSSSRLAFSLDIPSDATPDFRLTAGEGDEGGLNWKVRLQFVVAVPPSAHCRRNGHSRRSESGTREKPDANGMGRPQSTNLLPLPRAPNDTDHTFYAASTTLSPMLPVSAADSDHRSYKDDTSHPKGRLTPEGGGRKWQEMKTEVVECEVPVKVLAGNTAFVVRPSVWTV